MNDAFLCAGCPITTLFDDIRFVVWRKEKRKGKWTKPPITPGTGAYASNQDISTWRSRAEAMATLDKGAVDGLGYMLTARENLAAIDLDHCRDKASGQITPWAATLVSKASSYTEITPSEEGLRIIGTVDSARLPEMHFNLSRGDNGQHIEVYHRAARYITLSMKALDDAVLPLNDITPLLRDLEAERNKGHAGSPAAADDENFGDLPYAIATLIRNGAGRSADRSAQFYRVVAHLRELGWPRKRIESVLRAHPNGIAAKYLDGRDELSRHVLRCIDDLDEKAAAARASPPISGDLREGEDPPDYLPEPPAILAEVHALFRKWLSDGYDIDALNAVLAAAAAHSLGGDPLWLLLVSGPGNAKTETVQSLSGAGAFVTSTITSEGALLSATAKKDRTKAATGGLLRKIGDNGIVVVKDFTSILSMGDRNMRNAVLAALREIYDGRWERNVGTDGGLTLTWEGRITLIAAVTTAWDSAHAVISSMGDRFVVIRADSTNHRKQSGRQAIRNTGRESTMRSELATGVGALLAAAKPDGAGLEEIDEEKLLALADVVTFARTAVDTDYRGEVLDAHAPEMPTRFAKQLSQVVRGAEAIGLDHDDAMQLAIRCAHDSMPPFRLQLILDIAGHPDATTAEIRNRINKPLTTVKRQLASLQVLGLLNARKDKNVWRWSLGKLLNGDGLLHLHQPKKPEK